MDSLPTILNRRRFLVNSAKAGLVLGAPSVLRASNSNAPSETLNVALMGFGRHGLVLFEYMRNIPGIRVQAVCDIWDYSRMRARKRVSERQNGELPNAYVDLDEMLEKETGLDAAIIATPDFWHAPHAIRCMEAGLHVYCESMMAHTLDAAREIVRASERTGKLCQIGHQHRSSATYRYIRDQLLQQHQICGNIHNVNSQWNTSLLSFSDLRASPRLAIDAKILTRYGYGDMHQFLNWKYSRKCSQGMLQSFTARQMDLIQWILNAMPKTLLVSGGHDYFVKRDSHDNLMCIMESEASYGTLRTFHQSLATTNRPGIRSEKFMGVEGSIEIPNFDANPEILFHANGAHYARMLNLAKRGFFKPATHVPCEIKRLMGTDSETGIPADPSFPWIPYELPGTAPKPALELHLINFFDAIHGRAMLNCDARTAFAGEAPVYFMHAAGESGETHRFTAEQLAV